jgi:membrane protein YfhO
LALLLSGPALFPLLEAIPHSAEYRVRQAALASGGATQSVSVIQAAPRLLPDVLPFAHGIFGKSLVQTWRADGSGMPLGYSGAVLFPLALLGLLSRRGEPSRVERYLFLSFYVVGLLAGASAPVLLDLLDHLPGFRIALNYRLVFLAALGLAGLVALGAEQIVRRRSRRVAAISLGVAAVLTVVFLASRGIFRERELPADFVRVSFLAELVPVLLLGVAGFLFRASPRRLMAAALVLLAAERVLEMGQVYPSLPARTLAPPLSGLTVLAADGAAPYRVAAPGDVLRPNGATLYGLEDVRGYESIVLDRFADTFPLWCRPQAASFNRVDDLERPFLGFLGARYAILSPDAPIPRGWELAASSEEMKIARNPNALPRAFVPTTLRFESDAARTLSEMSEASSFSETAWVRAAAATARAPNGAATLEVREAGPDLVVTGVARERAFVATSVPDWPGWQVRIESDDASLPTSTVNHAFLGFWLPAGSTTVRLSYRPDSFRFGVWSCGLGAFVCVVLVMRRRRQYQI